MKLAAVLATGLGLLGLSGVHVAADPVPESATGVWSLGRECDGSAPVMMVNSRAALMAETRSGKPAVAIAGAEWFGGSVVLSFGKGMGEHVLPPTGSLRECAALPGLLPVVFAETVSLFRQFDDFGDACLGEEGPAPLCAAAVFETVDVTRDGRLSRSEIGRAIRAAAFFVGHQVLADQQPTDFVPVEKLVLAWLAGSAMGPVVAGNLVDSYDYDGDGFVSLAELVQDRTAEQGIEGVLAAMASEMAPEALSAVMRMSTGLLGLLR